MKAKYESSYDEYFKINLLNKNNKVVATTIIDIEDLEKCKKYKWTLSSEGYAKARNKNDVIMLHRLVMNAPDQRVVDHINHNRLDNRKTNLRICTWQQNLFNSKINKKSTSGIKGVSFNKKIKLWQAYITLKYKKIHLGWFKTKEEAAFKRKSYEKMYQEDYAYEG